MPADPPSPYGQDHSVELIQARIREKRLYEARFLFRQLGDEIEGAAREQLQTSLTGLFNQIEQLRSQARAHASRKNREQAEELYAAIERMAIDMPGLADEKQALAKLPYAVSAAKGEKPPSYGADKQPVAVEAESRKRSPIAPRVRLQPLVARLRQPRRYWRWATLALLLLIVAMFLFLPADKPERPVAKPPSSEQGTPQSIVIRPMVASGQEAAAPSRPSSPPPDALPADPVEKPAAKEGSLHLGTLQVEASAAKP